MVNWIDSDSSVLRHASGDFKRLGNRIFVFMVGGATRSEVRLVLILHKKKYKFPIWLAYYKIFIISYPNESVAHGAQAYNENEA